MNKILVLCLVILVLAATAFADSGSIWTTRDDCGAETQDENHYANGETVYINGGNFASGTYNWVIKGQPGEASCDPKVIVASGINVVGSSGVFCFAAYTVGDGDCGEYTVDFGKKNDNYRILGAPNNVPEFTAIGAGIAALGAGAVYFIRKRK
jgi:hypothetical protein